ncbi:MAG TPA: thymidine phosphorylase [Opitutaceae bacterium]|jgi:pyrimidine-nucleoside phosphorylase
MATPLFPQLVIARKRDGLELDREQIEGFVRGATDGSWTDYQLSALLMAIFLRGMGTRETELLTAAMMRSGTVADLSSVRQPKADKHSTGGVGDKVSIHLAPMVAACGVAVPMVSGRGLGHTGGTVDKLESIPGFRVNLSIAEYRDQLERIGLSLISQTAELAPADRKLYALRDVTATVESIPLICASILSKKLAEGIDVLVFDVKHGRGAFMKDKARARELAVALTTVARSMGKPSRAILTAMDEPLGRTVGNALEVAECVDCLKGAGPPDLMEVTWALAEQMLVLAGAAKTVAEARDRLERSVSSGAALAKFRELVAAQGGDARVAEDPGVLPRARHQAPLYSPADGWIQSVDALGVALAALRLGAGRARAEDPVDPAVGVGSLAKTGQRIAKGEALCMVHANDPARMAEAKEILSQAIVVGAQAVTPSPLVGEILG